MCNFLFSNFYWKLFLLIYFGISLGIIEMIYIYGLELFLWSFHAKLFKHNGRT